MSKIYNYRIRILGALVVLLGVLLAAVLLFNGTRTQNDYITYTTVGSNQNYTTTSPAVSAGQTYAINSVLDYSLAYAPFEQSIKNNTSHPSCFAADKEVADPSAPHGVFVSLDASGYQYTNGQFSQSALYYLLNDSRICGAEVPINWNQLEPENGTINMSPVTQACAPWIRAGKECAIKIFTVAYGGGNPSSNSNKFLTPDWVLSQIDTVPACGGAAPTPVYFEPGFYVNYENFIANFTKLVQNDSSIAYVRYGIGVGGELFPFKYLFYDRNQTCLSMWKRYNFSVGLWQDYALDQEDFEGSLHSPKLITVAMNQLNNSYQVDDAVGIAAIQNGLGFGFDGYDEQGSIDAYNSGQECVNDWCNLAVEANGSVPVYLESIGPSIPAGGTSGYLNTLIYFGLWRRAQIFELPEQEFLVADNASFNPAYRQQYSDALTIAANALGYS